MSSNDAVVYGFLSGNTSIQAVNVEDVTTSSFGIDVFDGICNIVIKRFQIIPLENEFQLLLSSKNDPIEFNVYEGENHTVQEKNLMGKFTLTQEKNTYVKVPSTLQISILFCIDGNGILSVSASERQCGDIFQVEKE